jgi:hypothetical protein
MSQTNFRNDTCFLNQQNTSNKSILNYTLDTTAFINKNECSDFTPTFLNYIPSGIKPLDIDLENELRGSVRSSSKCTDCKFNPKEIYTNLGNETNIKQTPLYVKPECKVDFKILPNGYYGYF